jgi:hypothetical protein
MGGNLMAITLDGTTGITTPDVDSDGLSVQGGATFQGATTEAVGLEVGSGRTGSGDSFVDLIGDTTYSDFGARFARAAGAGGITELSHRGTGDFRISSQDTGKVFLRANGGDRLEFRSDGEGYRYNAGFGYTDVATTFGRGGNQVVFTWTSPNLYGTVDNVIEMVIGNASDYRLKDNVEPLSGSVDVVMALRPVAYNPVSFDGSVDLDVTEVGFIAHEVQAIRPSVVTGERDGTNDAGGPRWQSVNYAGLVPDLTAALQEALQTIKALEARVAALETNA